MTKTPETDVESSEFERPGNSVNLDELSLEQSLRDFEIANARVMDLTARLTTMNRDLVQRTADLEKIRLRNQVLRSQNKQLRQELKSIQDSRSFKSAAAASRVVRGARKRLSR